MYAIKKRLVARIKHGGCRHSKFRKTDDFLAVFNQFSPNLVLMLLLQITLHLWHRKNEWWPESNMAAAAILNIEKLIIFTKFGKNVATSNNDTSIKTPCSRNPTWLQPPS